MKEPPEPDDLPPEKKPPAGDPPKKGKIEASPSYFSTRATVSTFSVCGNMSKGCKPITR
jgi:hypothetical protein